MIRLLLADDHTIVRQGIRAVLDDESDMTVVGEAEDGLEATRQIRRDHPHISVLVLTMHDNEEYIRQVLAAGDHPPRHRGLLAMVRRT